MYILSKYDLAVELDAGHDHYESYAAGKKLYDQGVKHMSVDGRLLSMSEMNDLYSYLRRVNRFKDTTKQWIREFEYFLTVLEGARERRQNARV